MDRPYQYIHVERLGSACAVRFIPQRLDDVALDNLGAELARLIDEDGCRYLIVNLGPEEPDCLYSVFLAKLISLKKRLDGCGGTLALANMTPHAKTIFQVSGVDKFFASFADQAEAMKALNA